MKALTVMPNFTIMAEVNNAHYMNNLFGVLRCYCEVEANVEHIDTYRITPDSFWEGMNTIPDVDFIQLLKDNCKNDIPSNVLTDLEKFKSRFGLITLVGDDCFKVNDSNLITEIKNNTKLNSMVYEYDGSLVFFSGSLKDIQTILSNDLFCPVKFRTSKTITYLIKDGGSKHLVKAPNPFQALKSLYGIHSDINEESLRSTLRFKKEKVTEEVVNEFIQVVLDSFTKQLLITCIPSKANRNPIKL